MLKFLTMYLLATGALAAIALAAPGLVAFGFFLLILPGLLLSLAPTAFLWGCIFTAAWLAARIVVGDNLATVLIAGVATVAVLAGATQANRTAGQAALNTSILPDVTPEQRIELKGDIRIDRLRPAWDNKNFPGQRPRFFACDTNCIALLFTPGVTSVTINDSSKVGPEDRHSERGALAEGATTYRLVPKAQCPDGGLEPHGMNVPPAIRGMDGRRAILTEWNLKLATEFCLTRSVPAGHFDFVLRQGAYGGPAFINKPWSFESYKPRVDFVEIHSGDGKLLVRRFKSQVSVLSRLLFISMAGGLENLRFGWGRADLRSKAKYAEVDLERVLGEHTNLRAKADPVEQLPAMRLQLRAALSDPAVPEGSAAFRLVAAFFQAIPPPASEDDMAIVTDLIRDPRLRRYEGLWELKKLPLDQQNAIRNALVERALAAKDVDSNWKGPAFAFLKNMPDGAFSKLTPIEEQLLALPAKRHGATPIIARLDESGPGRVPQLLSFIHEHSLALQKNIADANARRIGSYEKTSENEGHRAVVDSARIALCRLGPAASTALAPLEEMIAKGVVSPRQLEGHRGTDWNLTLVRLGKPIGELTKPDRISGTDQKHRDWIRYKLARFDPKRSC